MFEVHVTIHCPDLVAAAQLLAKVTPSDAAERCATANTALNTVASPNAVPGTAPGESAAAPNMDTAPCILGPAPQIVPLAGAPTYTIQQIAKAGADLFGARPELRPQVMALLTTYGVQSVTDLKPEHFGGFVTALRGLGAAI